YERINYDTGINGRLIVNGLGGNDAFFTDDNSAVTTLDGGLGNDNFQIGQIYGLSRDSFNLPPKASFNGPSPVTFTKDAVLGDTISSTGLVAAGFVLGDAIAVTGTPNGVDDGIYHVAAIIGTTTLRLSEKGIVTTLTAPAAVTAMCNPRLSGLNPAD